MKKSHLFRTQEEILNCGHGLYYVCWKSGGYSYAAVGSLYDGTLWIAPTNWTSDMTTRNPTATIPEVIDEIDYLIKMA